MGEPKLLKAARFGADDIASDLQASVIIRDADLKLHPRATFFYSDARLPCYEFSIRIGDEDAGTYYACLESDFDRVRELGNVSIELDRKFYRRNLPLRAT